MCHDSKSREAGMPTVKLAYNCAPPYPYLPVPLSVGQSAASVTLTAQKANEIEALNQTLDS